MLTDSTEFIWRAMGFAGYRVLSLGLGEQGSAGVFHNLHNVAPRFLRVVLSTETLCKKAKRAVMIPETLLSRSRTLVTFGPSTKYGTLKRPKPSSPVVREQENPSTSIPKPGLQLKPSAVG